jgi:hypothetical protein
MGDNLVKYRKGAIERGYFGQPLDKIYLEAITLDKHYIPLSVPINIRWDIILFKVIQGDCEGIGCPTQFGGESRCSMSCKKCWEKWIERYKKTYE